MNILQWNTRGYYARLPNIQKLIDELNPNILCLQETWLNTGKQPKLKQYQPFIQTNRTGRRGGGVLIAVKDNIPYQEIKLNSQLEACAIELHIGDDHIALCNIYISPDTPVQTLVQELNLIKNQLPTPMIICMDSNTHHVSWGSNFNDYKGVMIDAWITQSELCLLNTGEPTYLHSNGNFTHIDLTVASECLANKTSWQPHHDTMQSDHFPLQIKIETETLFTSIQRWNFKTADWKTYKKQVKIVNNFSSPDEAYDNVKTSILSAAHASIKTTNQTINSKYSKVWWNEACSKQHKIKCKSLKEYKKNLGNMKYWIQYKKENAKERYIVKRAKAESWNNYLAEISSSTSSKEIWGKVNSLKGKIPRKTITLKHNNNVITQPKEVANTFAEHYEEVYKNDTNDLIFNVHKQVVEASFEQFEHNKTHYYNENFTTEELKSAMQRCTNKITAPGTDRIPYMLIEKLPKHELQQLLNFYNYIYNNGIPNEWKTSILIPILKPGKQSTITDSYRPISLTNCICKIMEKMITKRLQHYIEKHNILQPYQSGFRSSRSTMDPLVCLTSSIQNAINDKSHCLAVFLDIQKAFDSVWHCGLLEKLRKIGLSGNLPCFIPKFLNNRNVQIRIQSTLSKQITPERGLPQGSVLSPVLFSTHDQ